MTFYVEASNIHTAESHRFGPFPGQPMLTYEHLRCWDSDSEGEVHPVDGDTVFIFSETWKGVTFGTVDGEEAAYGWRRVTRQETPQSKADREREPGRSFRSWSTVGRGPLWTDLTIVVTSNVPIPTNDLDELIRQWPSEVFHEMPDVPGKTMGCPAGCDAFETGDPGVLEAHLTYVHDTTYDLATGEQLTQDECDHLDLDGRDGTGIYTMADLTTGQRVRLYAYRQRTGA